jgi:hypothetical protein
MGFYDVGVAESRDEILEKQVAFKRQFAQQERSAGRFSQAAVAEDEASALEKHIGEHKKVKAKVTPGKPTLKRPASGPGAEAAIVVIGALGLGGMLLKSKAR